MIKTLTNLFKQDKEKFVVPKGVQDVIPIKAIYDDGIFQVGKDISYSYICFFQTALKEEYSSQKQSLLLR